MNNVVLLASNLFAPHAATTIVSLLENNKNLKFKIFIFTIDFNEVSVIKFKIIAKKYNTEIEIIKLSDYEISLIPKSGRWGFYALGRLVILKLLLNKVDKALILGADVIIEGSIKEIFELDIENYAFAATDDMSNCIKHKKRLSLPNDSVYANLDFYLVNFKFWREHDICKQTFDYVSENIDKIQVGDQDVINTVCNGLIKELPITYNMQSPYYYHKPQILPKHLIELETAKWNPIVIHFSEYVKPWHYECRHPLRSRYWYYQKLTEWGNVKKTFWSKRPYFHIPKLLLYYLLHDLGMKKQDDLYDRK